MARVTPSFPQTSAQKHTAARQSQSMGRLGGMLILLLALGAPAFVVGLVLYGLVAANRRTHIELKQTQITRRRYALVLLGMLIGMAVVGLASKAILAHAQQLAQTWQRYQPLVAQLVRAPNQPHWQALGPASAALWPQLRTLWLLLLPLASCIAVYLESTRVKTLLELRLEQELHLAARDRMHRRTVAQQVTRAPEQLKGAPIIGRPLSGALPDWRIKDWVTYPAALLNRHAVIIGGSGTGKTEFLLRVAYLTAKVLKWQVFYIDAKGDLEVANRFMTTMAHAGVNGATMFPDLAYHGWRGDATAILNRLMAIEDYSEPYYRAIAKTVLTLACHAPGGPPRSSVDLLDRLHKATLDALYTGSDDPRAQTLQTLTEIDFAGVYKRYFGFFDAIGRKLDGAWSFETADAGYILLDGLALKEEARSLGRYLMEDFAHYVSKRKKTDRRVLLIVDEFSAISRGGADAANLFERVRSYGAGMLVTSQSYEGLGLDAARLVGAAWATIAFQCTDPEPIAARAGTVHAIQTSLQGELTAAPGRNTLMTGREYVSGMFTQHEQEVPRLHPNVIRNLGIGECCIITNGAYQELRVARLPALPDLGMAWGQVPRGTSADTSTPPRRAPAVVVSRRGSDDGVAAAAGTPFAEVDAIQERDLTQLHAHEAAGSVAAPWEKSAPADQSAEQTETAVSVTVGTGNAGAAVQSLNAADAQGGTDRPVANQPQLPEERD